MHVLNAIYARMLEINGVEPMSAEIFKERKKIINELSKVRDEERLLIYMKIKNIFLWLREKLSDPHFLRNLFSYRKMWGAFSIYSHQEYLIFFRSISCQRESVF